MPEILHAGDTVYMPEILDTGWLDTWIPGCLDAWILGIPSANDTKCLACQMHYRVV